MISLSRATLIWIFELPSASKSTLTTGLAARLRITGRPFHILDDDSLRGGLCRELGFTVEHCGENLRAASEVALLAVRLNIWVMATMITSLTSQRAMIGEILEEVPLRWVRAEGPVETCRNRVVKGYYSRQQTGVTGDLTGITGADGYFEPPKPKALCLDTGRMSVTEFVDCLGNDFFPTNPNYNP